MPDRCDKLMILTGESVALFCASGNKDGLTNPTTYRWSRCPPVPRGDRRHARPPARRRRPHRRGDHRRGTQLPGRAQRQHGRDHPQRRAAGAGRLPLAGRRSARAPTRVRRPRRPWRAPTSSAAARPATAAPPTRCCRPTASAPGWRGGRCRRAPWLPASRPTGSRASRSWCSPTSTSCRPRAWPGTPTSWPRPAACASGCSNGWPPTCSTGRRPSTSRRRPTGPSGRRRAR